MSSEKITLYEFVGSCWANAPKIALSETGFKKDKDVEWVSINLAEGKNFEPDYLKINPAGTVPTLITSKGEKFQDSISAVRQIIKLAPHPPKVDAHTSTSIIEEIHASAHDPNATLLFAINDEDRKEKSNGLPKGFLQGRQKALDKLAENPPDEFKDFLLKKKKDNQQLLDFYITEPDESTKQAHYSQGQNLWKSVGIAVRGVVTQALKKNDGPFAGGEEPSEVDYHLITWLARTITNTGVEPDSPASVAIPKLQEYTGGHNIDPVVRQYWDAWLARPSFKDNSIH
ncbi:hypothetical protein L486_00066 [Kwoniella mangroviensis CBS 10435]|uniref:GST N-terminal domain-containing protein n=1 Tax=Kwoniella mangroviensis CBS 10435 TaxID=1331196 RepID=A0A1B9IY26_9TREE|nr:uncharacterized protein I203_00750 [Kwoniella mangroviensis CBS 8507]OCF60433.1 hypothetical protein L486_00066 [Kwoniella mangroviensis CBS 10435]OCF70615.1 hypothetical protein I203_00750 [Kwoniella mangroviensis CBS 8507]